MATAPVPSPPRFDRVCIVGAGAIGVWLGAGLARAGCAVSALARGATLQALRQHGLRLQCSGAAAPAEHWPVQASDHAAALGRQDLVVMAVKAPALAEVARQTAPLLGPDTVVLSAMNGVPWWFFQGFGAALEGTRLQAVDPDGVIGAALPARHTIGGVVHASCAQIAPGMVQHHFGNKLIVGEPTGQPRARTRALAALLARAGFEAVLSEQIQRDLWFKLWGNMTVNPISALTGATTDLILDDELVRGFVSRVMLEARDIGARIGLPIVQQPEDRHAVTRQLGAFKTSMLQDVEAGRKVELDALQDVEAGRKVELDALLGVVRELGQLSGVATPFTDALLGMSRLHARVRGLYP